MPTTLDIRGTQVQVFTHADAIARGHSRRAIDKKLASGLWIRVVAGAYATVPDCKMYAEDLHMLRVAGVMLNATPGWFASSWSSLVAHRLPLVDAPPQRVHVTRHAHRSTTRSNATSIRRDRALTGVMATRPQGIPALEVCDSLIEYAATSSFVSAVACADAAIHKKFVTADDLIAAAAATSRPGVRNCRAMAAFADGRAESPGESRLRILVHEMGLVATPQFPIHDGDGPARHRADLHIRLPDGPHTHAQHAPDGGRRSTSDGLLLEFDGKTKFTAANQASSSWSQFDHQRARDQRLTTSGYRVMHVTHADLARPELLKRQILLRLASAA